MALNRSLMGLRLPFKHRVEVWMSLCAQNGYDVLVYCTLRTFQEQEALYAQGRETLERVNLLRGGAKLAPLNSESRNTRVTNAKPGKSWHNYGLALDFVPVQDGGSLDWTYNPKEAHDFYDEIIQIARGVDRDIISGKSFKTFKDYGHLEYHPGITVREAEDLVMRQNRWADLDELLFKRWR